MRAREEGRAIRYVADARFAHYEGASAGRFDRESENERRFYGRWHDGLTAVPRTARGSVGAISVRVSPTVSQLSLAGLEDLESGLRSFGHPLHRGPIPAWRRLDRRYRESAALAWFSGEAPSPGVSIHCDGPGTFVDTVGAVRLRVPWLPCASAGTCRIAVRAPFGVGVVCDDRGRRIRRGRCGSQARDRRSHHCDGRTRSRRCIWPLSPAANSCSISATARLPSASQRPVRASMPRAFFRPALTDESAFGNVLLAQSRIAERRFHGRTAIVVRSGRCVARSIRQG